MIRAAFLALVLASCHAAPPRTLPAAHTAIASPGVPVAAVELGDALYVFTAAQTTLERGGRVVATVRAPDDGWADATTLPALDEATTHWVVARTTRGALYRITTDGERIPLNDALGLGPIHAVASAASTAAFAIERGVAVLRDRHLATFAVPHIAHIAATTNRVAFQRGDHIEIWNLRTNQRTDYTAPGAFALAFAGDSLVVAAPDALYLEDAEHRLVPHAPPGNLRAIAVASPRLWATTSQGIFLVDRDAFVRISDTAPAHLLGLASGDALAATPTATQRLALAATDDWATRVAPIYQRACARCHGPDGESGVDLSTPAAWRIARPQLIERIVTTRSMPPPGAPLTDDDRATLARWLRN